MSNPDVVSNVAHFGMLAIEKVNASPVVSEALGWNEYEVPATTVALGVPVMVGGLTESVAVGGVVEVEPVEVEDVAAGEPGLVETPSPPQPAASTTHAHRKKPPTRAALQR